MNNGAAPARDALQSVRMFVCCRDGIGWHTFRHTYRTGLDETGAPMKVQQELMRHSDIRTTFNIYGQALSSSKREANSKVVGMVIREPKKGVQGDSGTVPFCSLAEGPRERMAPQVGLEPTTLRLTAGCSAIELLRSTVTVRPSSDRQITDRSLSQVVQGVKKLRASVLS